MPPHLYLVRHAEGEHNATRNFNLPDPALTPKGKSQCQKLETTFSYHNDIDLVIASPLRRTIQTAVLSFGPTLARPDVPFVLIPRLQEVSDMGCDTGSSPGDLKRYIPQLFANDDLGFDLSKIDLSAVTEGWNVKTGYWAYEKDAISNRASEMRNWLFNRPEQKIIVVTHGAFLHFLTEDWDVDDPMTTTAYKNCEVRQFVFTPESTAEDAHVVETPESQRIRGVNQKEDDPHVLDELKTVKERANSA